MLFSVFVLVSRFCRNKARSKWNFSTCTEWY